MRNFKLLAALAALIVCCALAVGCNSNNDAITSADTTVADTEATVTTAGTVADTTVADTTLADTTVADTTVADTTAEDTTAADTTAEDTTAEGTGETESSDETTVGETTTEDDTTTEEITTKEEEITNDPNASEGLVFALNPLKDSYTVIDIGTCKDANIIIPAIYEGLPVVSISQRAFAGEKEITSVVIPNTVTLIGASAFDSCFKLASVTLSANLIEIADSAFADCSVLGLINIPKKVESIGVGVFAGCTGLSSIKVESGNNTYASIGNCLIETEINKLIAGCKNSTIPEGIEIIGDSAFARSFSLTKINIPESVMKIGKDAFAGCVLLKTFNYGGSPASWDALPKGSGWNTSVSGYNVVCAKG